MPSAADAMFLGQGMQSVIAEVRRRHQGAFSLAEELNSYANSKLHDIEAKKSIPQQFLIAALIPRLLTAFQGCVLMAERGLSAEATLLARKVLEVTFRIVAISKSPDLAAKYIQSDEVNRRDLLGKLRSLESVRHPADTTNSLDDLHAEVSAKVKTEGIHSPTTRDYAEQANLLDYYNTAYAYFSQSVHANVRDLEELLDTNEEGDLEAIRYGPDPDNVGNILSTAVESVVLSLEAVFRLFSGEMPVGLRHVRRKMEKLFEEQNK
jgi:hypothetical protein